MTDNTLSPKESIDIIERMISETRSSAKKNEWYFFLFGILTVICSLGHYILLKMNVAEAPSIWMLMAIGGILAGIKSYKDSKTDSIQSHNDSTYGFIWLAFGLSYFTVLGSSIILPESGYMIVNPMVMALAGGATMVSGRLMRFQPFIYGGLFMWVVSLISLAFPIDIQLLLNIVAISGGYLLPAWLLRKSE